MLKKSYKNKIIKNIKDAINVLKNEKQVLIDQRFSSKLDENETNFLKNLQNMELYITNYYDILSDDYENTNLIRNQEPKLSVYFDKDSDEHIPEIELNFNQKIEITNKTFREIKKEPIFSDIGKFANNTLYGNSIKVLYSNFGESCIFFPYFSNDLILFSFSYYDNRYNKNSKVFLSRVIISNANIEFNLLTKSFYNYSTLLCNYFNTFLNPLNKKILSFNENKELELIDKCLLDFDISKKEERV